MKIGLTGLPGSGKSTIYDALVGPEGGAVSGGAGKVQRRRAVIPVPDSRVDILTRIYKPRKVIYATLEVVDVVRGGGEREKNRWAEPFREMDALAIVLRNFPDAVDTPPAPLSNLNAVLDEFILADAIIVERRLERIAAQDKKGKLPPDVVREREVLGKIQERLEKGEILHGLILTPEEDRLIRGYQFLTLKPFCILLNSGEEGFGKNKEIIDRLSERFVTVECAGTFEMELRQLDPEEVSPFMEEMGMTESALDRIAALAYRTTGLITFLTVGEDEVRAWQVREGSTTVQAAGVIHSDLARGFIRAERFTYDDLIEHGSEKALKEKGLFHVEGKTYIVEDGDILAIRSGV